MTGTFHDLSAMSNPSAGSGRKTRHPLIPEKLPVVAYVSGMECIVERVSLDDLITGAWQQKRGVEFTRTINLGRYGPAALYWPKQEETQP